MNCTCAPGSGHTLLCGGLNRPGLLRALDVIEEVRKQHLAAGYYPIKEGVLRDIRISLYYELDGGLDVPDVNLNVYVEVGSQWIHRASGMLVVVSLLLPNSMWEVIRHEPGNKTTTLPMSARELLIQYVRTC